MEVLCPYDLKRVQPKEQEISGDKHKMCPECGHVIPVYYIKMIKENPKIPIIVISGVGFSGHGKTVYFAALMEACRRQVSRHWAKFNIMAHDTASLRTIDDNAYHLGEGVLPPASLKNFPDPTILSFNNIPKKSACIFLFFDTSGEAFDSPEGIKDYASFVKHSQAVTFFLSLPELLNTGNPDTKAFNLLNKYLLGMANIQGDNRSQHLVVALTKADELVDRLSQGNGDLVDFLCQGYEGLEDPHNYLKILRQNSAKLEHMLERFLGGNMFLNAARDRAHFRSTQFCVVSSLGASPQNKIIEKEVEDPDTKEKKTIKGFALTTKLLPRRVMDPMLLVMDCLDPFRPTLWEKIKNIFFHPIV